MESDAATPQTPPLRANRGVEAQVPPNARRTLCSAPSLDVLVQSSTPSETDGATTDDAVTPAQSSKGLCVAATSTLGTQSQYPPRVPRLALIFGALLAACASRPTGVRVVVESDLSIPDELDRIDIEISGGGFTPRTATMSLGGVGDPMLPGSLVVQYRGSGALGPYRATATGFAVGSPVAVAASDFTFVESREIIVPLNLARACVGVMCSPDETCVEGICQPVGMPDAGVDAGPMPDGGFDAGTTVFTPPPAPCDRACDMCGGTCTDVRWDEANCGSCGRYCAGDETCIESGCAPCSGEACSGECVDTDTNYDHCGGCDRPCAADQICNGGTCAAAPPGGSCGNPIALVAGSYSFSSSAGDEVVVHRDLVDGGYGPRCQSAGNVSYASALRFVAPATGTLRVTVDPTMNAAMSIEIFADADDRCTCPLPGACSWATSTGASMIDMPVDSGVAYRIVISLSPLRTGTVTLGML